MTITTRTNLGNDEYVTQNPEKAAIAVRIAHLSGILKMFNELTSVFTQFATLEELSTQVSRLEAACTYEGFTYVALRLSMVRKGESSPVGYALESVQSLRLPDEIIEDIRQISAEREQLMNTLQIKS